MVKSSDLILVTGASGNRGNATARQLLANGYRVRVMTLRIHSPRAALLAAAGAEVVYGSLDDPALLYAALDEVKGVFAVQDSRDWDNDREETRSKRLTYLAKEQGVDQYVYSSVAAAPDEAGIPHFAVKARVEETIRSSNFDSYSFLRGTFFMESLLDMSMFPEVASGKLICPVKPEVKVQMISAEDIAKFALYAFQNPELMHGVELDLASDEHTFAEMAEVLSRVLKKNIEFASMDIEEYCQLRNFPSSTLHNIKRICEFWEMPGWDVDIGGLMLASRNYGIDIKTLHEWANTVATKFGGPTRIASTAVSSS